MHNTTTLATTTDTIKTDETTTNTIITDDITIDDRYQNTGHYDEKDI